MKVDTMITKTTHRFLIINKKVSRAREKTLTVEEGDVKNF
jgi:hypothetical protein